MYRNFKMPCVLSIFLLVVFGEAAAEENFQLIGFRGNRLVEIELPSKERTLHVFDYTLAVEGATTIDQERIVLSYNNELHIFNRRTNKETKLGSGRYPTYNQNTKSLYFFSSSFTDGAWKHYLRKSELANDELSNTDDLSVIPENQSGGQIFVCANNKIIFQSGGSEVFEWDEIADKLTALPIQDCNLILLRSKTNGLVCKSWGLNEYKEVSLIDYTEKPLKDVRAYLQEYIPSKDMALGFNVHFSVLKGEYFNMVIYNFPKQSLVELKKISTLENIVWQY